MDKKSFLGKAMVISLLMLMIGNASATNTNVTADAYVTSYWGDNNYGYDQYEFVKVANGGMTDTNVHGLFATTFTGNVTTVTFNFNIISPNYVSDRNISFGILQTPFNESNVTYNTKPTDDYIGEITIPSGATGWFNYTFPSLDSSNMTNLTNNGIILKKVDYDYSGHWYINQREDNIATAYFDYTVSGGGGNESGYWNNQTHEITLNATEDTYTDQGFSSQNFNGETTFKTGYANGNGARAFIKTTNLSFLSEPNVLINNLTLYARAAQPMQTTTVSSKEIFDTWNVNDITWNTEPVYNSSELSNVSVSNTGGTSWHGFNLMNTNLSNFSNGYVLTVDNGGGSKILWDSNESGYIPYFVVNYTTHEWIMPTPPGWTNATLTATDDSYVDLFSSGTNFGTDVFMLVSWTSFNKMAYIKFNHSVLPQGIYLSEARVGVYSNYSTGSNTNLLFDVCEPNTNWNETDITWDNSPSCGTFTTNFYSNMTESGYREFDVLGNLTPYGYRIHTNEDWFQTQYFDTKESTSGFAPYLYVNYTYLTPPNSVINLTENFNGTGVLHTWEFDNSGNITDGVNVSVNDVEVASGNITEWLTELTGSQYANISVRAYNTTLDISWSLPTNMSSVMPLSDITGLNVNVVKSTKPNWNFEYTWDITSGANEYEYIYPQTYASPQTTSNNYITFNNEVAHADNSFGIRAHNITTDIYSNFTYINNTIIPNEPLTDIIGIPNVTIVYPGDTISWEDTYGVIYGYDYDSDGDYGGGSGCSGSRVTYTRNFTNGSLYCGTYGRAINFVWTVGMSDVGSHYFSITADDNYGSTYQKNFTIAVLNLGITNLNVASGNFYLNWTWNGNTSADMFNVWINETEIGNQAEYYYQDTYSPHATKNISIRGYNTEFNTYGSWSNRTDTIPNNVITITNLTTDYMVQEGNTLYLNADYTDPDSDTGTFSDNATEWNVDANGVISWQTTEGTNGVYHWYIEVADGYGSTSRQNITVTVLDSTPSVPTDLTNTTGNFYIRWDYIAGENTDDIDVLIDGVGVQHNTVLFYNGSYSALASKIISIRGHNHTINAYTAWFNQTTSIPNNPIYITDISSSYVLNVGQTLNIDANYSDIDGDTGTFGRNFTNGTFDSGTGILSWTTDVTDIGIHNVQISVADGYGSTDTKDFTIEVLTIIPDDITGLSNSTGVGYINWTWNSALNTSTYQVLIDNSQVQNNELLYYNDSYLSHVEKTLSVRGYYSVSQEYGDWSNQTTTVGNNPISLTGVGSTYILQEGQTLNIDAGYSDPDSDIGIFSDNATEWAIDTGTGIMSWGTVDGDQGEYNWQICVSDGYDSTDCQDFTVTVLDSTPTAPSIVSNTAGNFWLHWYYTAGSNNDDIEVVVNNVSVQHSSALDYNGTLLPPHWNAISIRGHNHTLDSYSAWANESTEIPNNPMLIGNISDNYTLYDNEILEIYPTYYDADNDVPEYIRNFNEGDFSNITGDLYWYHPGFDAIGNHTWEISVHDGDGSESTKSFTVQILDSDPPDITGLSAITGNFYIHWSWDDIQSDPYCPCNYNILIDGVQTEAHWGQNIYNVNYTPHASKTISVRSYSIANTFYGAWSNFTGIILNNVPILSGVANSYTVDAGTPTLNIDADMTDLDGDTPIFLDDSDEWDINNVTGVVSWTPTVNDTGSHYWRISVSDGHGSIVNKQFIVNVYSFEYIPLMSQPTIVGNYIKAVYGNDVYGLNPWESPNFVWGIYNYSTGIQKEVCVQQGTEGVFACNLRQGIYNFTFEFSDSHKYPEVFYSSNLIVNQSVLTASAGGALSAMPQEQRESTLRLNFLDIAFIMFLAIVGIMMLSFFDKRKVKVVKER